MLTLVAGQVPLLVEVKDQDGAMGPDVGPLEAAAVQALAGYDGPVALMSFNPHSVAALAGWRPTSRAGSPPAPMRARMPGSCPRRGLAGLRAIADFDRTGACFISHDWRDLSAPRVAELRAAGVPVLCWTVRTPEDEAIARAVAHNITFEGYPA